MHITVDSLAPSTCTITDMIYSLHCMIHCMSTYIFTMTLTVYMYCTTCNKHACSIMYVYLCASPTCMYWCIFSVNAATCHMYFVISCLQCVHVYSPGHTCNYPWTNLSVCKEKPPIRLLTSMIRYSLSLPSPSCVLNPFDSVGHVITHYVIVSLPVTMVILQ